MDGPEITKDDPVSRALGGLDHLLDVLHDKVLRPIILAGRAVAYGFVILLMGLLVGIVSLVALIRLLDSYAFEAHQWITYLVTAAIFLGAGAFIWRMRRPVALRKKS